jgi:superfamily II RNA helicase
VFALLDETSITYDNLVWFQSGRSEPVRSRFNLNYSAVLNLFRRVGDEVPQAWQRSFARYLHESKKQPFYEATTKSKGKKSKGRPGRRDRRGPKEGQGAKVIRARLQVLRDYHYIEGDALTRKGQFCAHVNGYEVSVTEAYEGGWLFRCDPVEAAMLFASIVYESRPADNSSPPTRKLRGIRVPFELHMEAFAAHERAAGIRDPLRPPDFGIAGPVQRWAEGQTLERVLEHTTLAAGDLVRVLRMTIQLLRQAAHALPKGDPCIRVLHEARHRIDRDDVDAKRQLELG